MITAHDITRGKPDPEPYLKGATVLGFAPQDCVVIEDAAAGVRSGKAAGARVMALQTTETNDDLIALGADWIVKDCSSIVFEKEPLEMRDQTLTLEVTLSGIQPFEE
jgi:sugar-phosphatase